MPIQNTRIEIRATTRTELDEQLETAHRQLQEIAHQTRLHGILVTKHGPGTYSAELSPQVPYGTTKERTTLEGA